MEIRRLAPDDDLRVLVRRYVEELWGFGGEILPTQEAFCAVEGAARSGVCVVAGDPLIAWTAAIPCPMPWPTKYGRMALSLGTYVEPEHRRSGLAKALRERIQDELKEEDFDTLLGGVHVRNDPGRDSLVSSVGFTPHQILGYKELG